MKTKNYPQKEYAIRMLLSFISVRCIQEYFNVQENHTSSSSFRSEKDDIITRKHNYDHSLKLMEEEIKRCWRNWNPEIKLDLFEEMKADINAIKKLYFTRTAIVKYLKLYVNPENKSGVDAHLIFDIKQNSFDSYRLLAEDKLKLITINPNALNESYVKEYVDSLNDELKLFENIYVKQKKQFEAKQRVNLKKGKSVPKIKKKVNEPSLLDIFKSKEKLYEISDKLVALRWATKNDKGEYFWQYPNKYDNYRSKIVPLAAFAHAVKANGGRLLKHDFESDAHLSRVFLTFYNLVGSSKQFQENYNRGKYSNEFRFVYTM